MTVRFLYQRHPPSFLYKPLFYECITGRGCTAEHGWIWTMCSTGLVKNMSEIRTSYHKLANLFYCHHNTARRKIKMLEDADLAIVDNWSSRTSFRLRLRVGPGGPIYEEGGKYQSGGYTYLRTPQHWIYYRPDFCPEAKVFWCWSMGSMNWGENTVQRTSVLRKLFNISRYKERKAMEELIDEDLMALAGRRNTTRLYGACELEADENPSALKGMAINPAKINKKLVDKGEKDKPTDVSPVKERRRLIPQGTGDPIRV